MTFADFFRVLLPSKVIWDADFDSDIHFALRRLEMMSWNHQVIKCQWRHRTRKWFFEFLTPKNYPSAFKNHRNVFYSSQGTRWTLKFCSSSIRSKVIGDHGFRHFSALDLTSEVNTKPFCVDFISCWLFIQLTFLLFTFCLFDFLPHDFLPIDFSHFDFLPFWPFLFRLLASSTFYPLVLRPLTFCPFTIYLSIIYPETSTSAYLVRVLASCRSLFLPLEPIMWKTLFFTLDLTLTWCVTFLTRALLGGVWTPPPPSGFSKLAKIRRRAAPRGFHPPYPPSFPQLLWKFRPNAMWGQVTRSGQVTQLQNNFPIAPRLQCFRESYENFGIWWGHHSSVPTKRISRIFLYRWPHVRSFFRPPHYKSMGKKSTPLYLLCRKPIWVESYSIRHL